MGSNSCEQQVSSKFGGSWTMGCIVTWVAEPGWAEVSSPEGSAAFITEVKLDISEIVLSFSGNPSGNVTPYPFSEILGSFYDLRAFASSGEVEFTLEFSNKQLDLSVAVANNNGGLVESDREFDPKLLKEIVIKFRTTPGYNGNLPSFEFSSCEVEIKNAN